MLHLSFSFSIVFYLLLIPVESPTLRIFTSLLSTCPRLKKRFTYLARLWFQTLCSTFFSNHHIPLAEQHQCRGRDTNLLRFV